MAASYLESVSAGRQPELLFKLSDPMNSTLRQVFRQLRKSKGFTAITLVTLALCIGATTAIFSTVYSLMLKPLPFNEPDRIVELYTSPSISIIRRTRHRMKLSGCGVVLKVCSERMMP